MRIKELLKRFFKCWAPKVKRVVDVNVENTSNVGQGECVVSVNEPLHTKEICAEEHEMGEKNVSLAALQLSNRSYNALMSHGVNTLAELLQLSEADLYSIRNMGKKSVAECLEIQKLHKNGQITDMPQLSVQESVQKIPSYVADKPFANALFSVRLSKVLKENNIENIRQLLKFSPRDLLAFRNFGKISYKELLAHLEENNISLGTAYEIVECMPPESTGLSKGIAELLQELITFEEELEKNEAERYTIYKERLFASERVTLQMLALRLGVTRERVRQIEKGICERLSKLVLGYKELFDAFFAKYGKIVSYETVVSLKPLLDIGFFNFLEHLLYSSKDFAFKVDLKHKLLIMEGVSLSNFFIEEECETSAYNEDAIDTIDEIKDAIRSKLVTYVKDDAEGEIAENFNAVFEIIVTEHFEKHTTNAEKLELAFRDLYPSGFHITQIDEVYEAMMERCPFIVCSTPRALQVRLTAHCPKIILSDRGYYQHVDTLCVSNEGLKKAVQMCKEELLHAKKSLMIKEIYRKHEAFFREQGIFSYYLLFSLLKLLNDSELVLRRLKISMR